MSVLEDFAKEEAKLDMTPMIDVVFQLIIFFMCNIKYKTLEGKLSAYLPKDVGVNTSQAEFKEKVEIMIRVVEPGAKVDPRDASLPWSGAGRFDFVGRKLTYQIGLQKTTNLDELQKILRSLYQSDPERKSAIDCRPGTVYADMVPVLDATVDAGFRDITFVGEYKPGTK